MHYFTIYNTKLSKIKSVFYGRYNDACLNLESEDEFFVVGNYPSDEYYVKKNKFIKLPKKPSDESFWEFNTDIEKWFDPRPPEFFVEEENKKVRMIREHRNKMLTESDWTQLPDSPLEQEKKAAWAEYRQQLRDIVITDPDSFTFPQPPY